MLQHFEAGYDVKFTGMFAGVRLRRRSSIIDIGARLRLMEAGHGQGSLGHVDTGNRSAVSRHRFGENATAATNIERPAILQARSLPDVIESQRVDFVQWSKLSGGVPPAGSQCVEFRNLGIVNIVLNSGHSQDLLCLFRASKKAAGVASI